MQTSSPAWHWLWVVLAIVVGWKQLPAFIESMRPPEEELQKEVGDFFQEWSSARNFFEGRPIYDSLETAYDRYLGYPRTADQHMAVRINGHPPTAVLIALPFGLLSYPDALLAWNLLSLAATAGGIALVCWQLNWRPGVWAIFPVMIALLLCFPFRQHIRLGQLNLLLLLLISATWAADRRGHWVWAGIWLGSATAIKIFPGFLILYWLLQRWWRPRERLWRPAAMTLASFAAFTLATVAVLGTEPFHDFATKALPAIRPSWSGWSNLSLTSYWIKLFDPAASERVTPIVASTTIAWTLVAASSAIVLALLVTAARKTNCASTDFLFAATVLGMLLLSPVTWSHYLVILWLPAAILWPAIFKLRTPRLIYIVCIVLLCIDPLPLWKAFLDWPNGVSGPVQTLTILGLPTYALAGLFACSLAVLATPQTPETTPLDALGQSAR
jgi:hypothetical protein